jgi:AbrB family looped-hinge helix DNA binding protein
VRITSRVQITIPVEIREKLGLLPHSEVEFELVGSTVRIRKSRRSVRKRPRGRSLVERLRGRGSVRMSTDEILALTRGRR